MLSDNKLLKTDFCVLTDDVVHNNEIFRKGGEILRNGGLVAFPTETVYGLGANALDPEAAKKIYAAKGRPSDNPLIVHIAHIEDADKYCITNDVYYKLAEKFLPGALTVIMPKRDCIPHEVTGGLETVAIRFPSDKNARSLIDAAGIPVAAPSANRSGKPSPTTAKHVLEDMDGRIDMIIDGGECSIGLESTIVSIGENCLTILRPGGVTAEMLGEICHVKIDKVVTEKLAAGERPLAPGMKYRHYAPDTKVILIDSDREKFVEYINDEAKSRKIGVIVSESEAKTLENSGASVISYGSDARSEAHNLFDRLRSVDELGCDIVFARLPDKQGIGLAIYNRIIKAAGYEIIHI